MSAKQIPTAPYRKLQVAVIALAATLAFFLPVLWVIGQRRAADREHESYKSLRAMGATGDDWPSLREFITGRPPIVQIDVPANIEPKTAFDALRNLQNLEALTLAYSALSTDQLRSMQRLRLNSIRFQGSFPRDSDVPDLVCLRGVRFLYVPSKNLSVDAQSRLRSLLPSSQIEFE
jgi:hypothetical protein